MRRTTVHTTRRPDGLLGNVHVTAGARDLWTGEDGRAEVVAEAALEAEASFVADRNLRALRVEPTAPGLDGLIGTRVGGGFRPAVDDALVGEDPAASLRYQLLDDLPTVLLVSGVALNAAGMLAPYASLNLGNRADICAGWAAGGTMLVAAEQIGHIPLVTGPRAPSLESRQDPMAWHRLGTADPYSTRRCRRIDVWSAPGADRTLSVEGYFRDTLFDGDGQETVVHEYLVSAELEAESYCFISCRADVGVLPWVECPSAANSAGRVVGTSPADLRQRVKSTFVGVSTCTHLNDTLRALAALPFLAGLVERSRGS